VDKAIALILNVLIKKEVDATFFYTARAALHNPDILRKVLNAGHEIGCHSYQHETLGEAKHSIPGDRVILPEEIPVRLSKATEVIKEISGKKPLSFRAPSFCGSEIMVRTLEKLEYLVDSSYNITDDKRNIFPYHPDLNDWTKTGSLKILEIPIAGLYGGMVNNLGKELKQYMKEKSKSGSSFGQWPILRLFGAKEFNDYLIKFTERQIQLKGIATVVVILHPWEFIPMLSELKVMGTRIELENMLHLNCGDKTLESLERFIDYFKEKNFNFLKMIDFYRVWKKYSKNNT